MVTSVFVAVAIAGCGGSEEKAQSLKIAASTQQVANLVNNVSGTRAPATSIAPVGINPHTYVPQPSAPDNAVNLVFINGGDMDPWAEQAVKQNYPKAKVVDLSKSVQLIKEGGRMNSHWITDPANIKLAAAEVQKTLSQADPDGADTYAKNRANFDALTSELDTAIVECLKKDPLPGALKAVTAHDDVEYLSRRYKFEVVEQISESGDATEPDGNPRTLGKQAKSRDASVVATAFSQMDVPGGLIAQVAGVPKIAIFTDNISDSTTPANTLLRSIGHTTGLMVEASTGGKTRCTFPKSL